MAQDMSKYLDLFVQESSEHLETIASRLVDLERSVESGAVDEIFRRAHSIKGMAASMGIESITQLAHGLEDVFEVLRRGGVVLEQADFDLLHAAVDGLSALLHEAAEGQASDETEVDWRRLVRGLKGARARLDARAAEAEAPPPIGEGAGGAGVDEAIPRLRIVVEIAGTSKVPGVRGFLVYKRLSAVGEIEESSPSLADLKAGRLPDRRLEIVLATREGRQAVERQLGTVSEIRQYSIEPHRRKAPAEPPRSTPASSPGRPVRTVRIRTDLLDGFMDTVGELILASDRLRALVGRAEGEERTPVDDALDHLERTIRGLHAQVMATRMIPLSSLTDKIPRVVRDVARSLGKEVEVEVAGADIELDRAILDELEAPLTHLVRNAIDHGLEPPDERDARGKSRAGRLSISAFRDRDVVVLELSDDGRGFDRERLKKVAVEAGHLSRRQAEALSDREVLMLACLPGLSTREEVSDISGRGVGLDAVKATVEGLGGNLEIESEIGRGTTFRLRVPLTVAIQRLLLLGVADELFGLPMGKVLQVVEVPRAKESESRGQVLVPFREGLVPAWSLGGALGIGETPREVTPYVVTEGEGGVTFALAVDRIAGHLEAVIKPLGKPLEGVEGLSGVTLLPDGRPLVVLDPAALGRAVGL